MRITRFIKRQLKFRTKHFSNQTLQRQVLQRCKDETIPPSQLLLLLYPHLQNIHHKAQKEL